MAVQNRPEYSFFSNFILIFLSSQIKIAIILVNKIKNIKLTIMYILQGNSIFHKAVNAAKKVPDALKNFIKLSKNFFTFFLFSEFFIVSFLVRTTI